ncbi:hypothetical protein, partial [Arthrobacter sp. E3]|uniref:hypothetical protein n=1 Tax=Arthrobacter sp. E3 TaxID=517402 RepID=UPI001A94B69E
RIQTLQHLRRARPRNPHPANHPSPPLLPGHLTPHRSPPRLTATWFRTAPRLTATWFRTAARLTATWFRTAARLTATCLTAWIRRASS